MSLIEMISELSQERQIRGNQIGKVKILLAKEASFREADTVASRISAWLESAVGQNGSVWFSWEACSWCAALFRCPDSDHPFLSYQKCLGKDKNLGQRISEEEI